MNITKLVQESKEARQIVISTIDEEAGDKSLGSDEHLNDGMQDKLLHNNHAML